MPENDLSRLMRGMNLHSGHQQNPHVPTYDRNHSEERKSHARRRRRRRSPKNGDEVVTSPHLDHKTKCCTREDELAARANKITKRPEQPSPPTTDPDSQLKVNERAASELESSPAHSSSSEIHPSHVYIVQVMRPSENVEGVFSSSVDANKRALDYLETKYGIKPNEISEERGLFGQATSTAKASKRLWQHTDTLEILTRGGTPWIRVLKKPLYSFQAIARRRQVYLSLDRSDGIFVIGAYQSQDAAWEGCKKYWSDLSVCASMLNLKEWYDGRFQSCTGHDCR